MFSCPRWPLISQDPSLQFGFWVYVFKAIHSPLQTIVSPNDSFPVPSQSDKIIPEVDVSYRILAHLLLGVVRIFSRKVDFLYDDCHEALTRVQKSMVEMMKRESGRSHAHMPSLVVATKEVRPLKKTNKGALHAPPLSPQTPPSQETPPARLLLTAGDGAGTSKRPRFSTPEQPMFTQAHRGFTIPETFELASFDLGLPEERDDDNNHHLMLIEDDQEERSFFTTTSRPIVEPYISPNYDCFTPVADSVIQDMISVDLELVTEEGTMSFPSAMKSLSINVPTDGFDPFQQDYSDMPSEIYRNVTHGKAPLHTGDGSTIPSTAGLTSPQFTVATPAKDDEGHHFLRKRKWQFSFDNEAIVLSNEILRKGLDDTSDVVKKRRKTPHTYLDIWKANKLSDLDKAFQEPLICFNYFETEELPQTRRSVRASSSKTTALNAKIPSSTISLSKMTRRSAKRKSAPVSTEQRDTAKRKSTPASIAGSDTAMESDLPLPDVPPENGDETNVDAHLKIDVVAGEPPVETPLEDGGDDASIGKSVEKGKGTFVESPENGEETNVDARVHLNGAVVAGETPVETSFGDGVDDASAGKSVEKGKGAFVEPVSDDRLFEAPGETPGDGGLVKSSGETAGDKRLDEARPVESTEVVVSDVDTDSETDSGSESRDRSGLSARTRVVAKSLHKAFKVPRFQDQGGALSLMKILDGKNRPASARYFYETLVLTSRGSIQVNQDSSYGDITIPAASERTLRPVVVPVS